MPLFQIRALPQKKGFDPTPVLKRLCMQVAELMKIDSRHVWATWEEIKPGFYVEGEVEALDQNQETHPPIVTMIFYEGRTQEMIQSVLVKAAQVIGTSLEIDPGNVFITYHEARSGQIFSGGKIRTS